MALEGKERAYTIIAKLPDGETIISEVVGVGTDAIRAFMDKGPFWVEAFYSYEKEDGSGFFNGVVYNDSLIRTAKARTDAILDLFEN